MNNYIELFSGAGGLGMGFATDKTNNHVMSFDIEKNAILSSKKYFYKKFQYDPKSFQIYDIQKTDDIITKIKKTNKNIHFIIGGPPCQAYSVANRKHYKKNEKDPKNKLFQSYLKIANVLNINFFVFENVPGIMSSVVSGKKIVDLIRQDAYNKGFILPKNFKEFIFDMSEFGIPQKRKRLILIGLRKKRYKNYDVLFEKIRFSFESKKLSKKKSVSDALKGLGTFKRGKKGNYIKNEDGIYPQLHAPRFHNNRDINIFKECIESSRKNTFSTEFSIYIYNKYHNKNSAIHKYHVLEKDKPSTTILAHLHKDGNRFILESDELRTLTPREAARIQTFPDDYEFIGGQTAAFKMIGNAVPPKFSEIINSVVKEVLDNGK